MTEHFLTYEQSLAVKELGFDEPSLSYYGESQEDSEIVLETRNVSQSGDLARIICTAPLKSQFFKWVREKHELRARNYRFVNMSGGITEGFEIFKYEKDTITRVIGSTYEQAEDACINKIIELIQEK